MMPKTARLSLSEKLKIASTEMPAKCGSRRRRRNDAEADAKPKTEI